MPFPSTAHLSIAALVAVIALSARGGAHAGVAALAFAGLIGGYSAGLSGRQLAALFPADLFLVLLGTTLLFAMAKANGALDRLTGLLLRLAGRRTRLLLALFFAFALALSALGAGNIAAVALLAPVALDSARRAGVGLVLMTFMVVTGANAGTFSPLAFTGIVAGALTDRAGLSLAPWRDIFLPSFAAQCLLAAITYALTWHSVGRSPSAAPKETIAVAPDGSQKLTLAALGALAAAVILLKMDVGVAALALAALLGLARAADQKSALERLPWSAIVMVCGVSTLVGLASRSGGLDLVARWLAAAGGKAAVPAAVSFAAAFTSIYSSSSGVVMPAFLPMVPELSARSGADPMALAAAINVSSHLVDVSPLSTLGALCVAAVPAQERDPVFRRLLSWGLGMSFVAAATGYLLFGILWPALK